MVQPCNTAAFMNNSFMANFGVVDYDWSDAKNIWSAAQPMDCEEALVTQADGTHALQKPGGRVWVYRNSVKALPWFTSVREKLEDPAYWGWFLAFKNCTDGRGGYVCGPNATQNLYHDFEQTPRGDCGVGVECGEYLFDFRNDSLRAWMSGDYVLSNTALGNPNISGFFFDDSWSANGPSEEDAGAVNATGVNATEMTLFWNASFTAMAESVIAHGGFAWQLMLDGGGQTAPGRNQTDPQPQCAEWLRANCGPDAPFLAAPLFFGFTRVKHSQSFPLPAFEQDLATFLLVRGPYAWLGYGWVGCNQPWEFRSEMAADYGEPVGTCYETTAGSGVFERQWTKATVQMDCGTWTANITML